MDDMTSFEATWMCDKAGEGGGEGRAKKYQHSINPVLRIYIRTNIDKIHKTHYTGLERNTVFSLFSPF
jgi:hypothetical protein